ncbi:MAG TPA: hypothetical protein VIG99_26855 [Myxococcaceae bacterium]
MPPDEDLIEVAFSAAEGGRLEKLVAKIGDHAIGTPSSPYKGSHKAPAGKWKLRWEIRGTRRGQYHLSIKVNGEKKFDEDISFDELGVDNGAYPV